MSQKVIERINTNIDKIQSKDFNVYFYVLDTKGNPSGSLEYLYNTALMLSGMGYNVTMLHSEEEFIGVGEWLGEKYASLKHANVETENVEIGPSDFLFIPEIFSTTVMPQTKNLPCKRVLIVQNYNYLSEFMPIGTTPQDYGVNEIITTTNVQKKIINEYFPGIRVSVVEPSIDPMFRDTEKPRKLIVNVVSKNQSDIKRIILPFYWKYPVYKFVSFRDLRGLSQDTFCEALREAAITIVFDDKSNFMYSALESMRCGSITLTKIPDTMADWMTVGEGVETTINDSCLWFDNVDMVPDMLASIIRSWTLDKITDEFYQLQHEMDDKYTRENMEKEIKNVYCGMFNERVDEMKSVLRQINKES